MQNNIYLFHLFHLPIQRFLSLSLLGTIQLLLVCPENQVHLLAVVWDFFVTGFLGLANYIQTKNCS